MKPLTKARFWLLSNSSLSRRLMWLTDANLSTRSWGVADRRLEEKEAATFSHTLLGAIFQFQRDIVAEDLYPYIFIGGSGRRLGTDHSRQINFHSHTFFQWFISDEFFYKLGLFGTLKLTLALQFIVTNAYFSVACNTKSSVYLERWN